MARIVSAIGLTRVCLAAFSRFPKDGRIQAKVHNC